MNEKEKDTSRPCNHNLELSKTFVSSDETEFVKIWKCTECYEECEQRSERIGARPKTPIIL